MLLISLGVGVVVAYGAASAFLYLSQRRMVFPAWAVEPSPEGWHQEIEGLERLTLKTADGEELLAYWRAPQPGMPSLVTFHGNGSTPQPYVERFTSDSPWLGSGFGVLGLAHRGYPGSSGSPSEEGLILDGLAAVDFLRSELGETQRVILHGHSLGTAVAIAVATEREVEALYLEAPFSSARALADKAYPFMPTFLMRDPFYSDRRLPEVTAERVFIVHGTADGVVAASFSEPLAEKSGKVERHLVEGADHVSVLGTRDAAFFSALGLAEPGKSEKQSSDKN
jgi:fermentation-respiration switch protein FrsA (DUF1100 family)